MGRRLEYEVKTSVRLNMSNPQHVKINDVIQNLDPKIFKSKNQFIIDAIQFYIDNYGKETFVIKKKEKERAEYIRSEDIEDIKEEVIEVATNEATVMMDKDAFINRVRGYQDLAERMRAVAASKNANLSDVTISKKLIIEENDHAVKTRVPGTWGEEARYVWLRKENIMEIHGGKTMLTFLDSTKDYKLYDEQNRVVTTQKGTELYTHYDKVESSVRERYEKVQKQQKKTTQKKTVTTKKAR